MRVRVLEVIVLFIDDLEQNFGVDVRVIVGGDLLEALKHKSFDRRGLLNAVEELREAVQAELVLLDHSVSVEDVEAKKVGDGVVNGHESDGRNAVLFDHLNVILVPLLHRHLADFLEKVHAEGLSELSGGQDGNQGVDFLQGSLVLADSHLPDLVGHLWGKLVIVVEHSAELHRFLDDLGVVEGEQGLKDFMLEDEPHEFGRVGVHLVPVNHLDQPHHSLQLLLKERTHDHLVAELNLSLQSPFVNLLFLRAILKHQLDGLQQLSHMSLVQILDVPVGQLGDVGARDVHQASQPGSFFIVADLVAQAVVEGAEGLEEEEGDDGFGVGQFGLDEFLDDVEASEPQELLEDVHLVILFHILLKVDAQVFF